jgi:mono/diheme cytochrome c family protein
MNTANWASGARSLAELVAAAESDGYTGQMGTRLGGVVHCFTCGSDLPAGELDVDALAREEGASDPGDEAALVAITCPVCHTKGALVLRYGPEASEEDAEVLTHLSRG